MTTTVRSAASGTAGARTEDSGQKSARAQAAAGLGSHCRARAAGSAACSGQSCSVASSARSWRSSARSVWSAPARAGALAGAQDGSPANNAAAARRESGDYASLRHRTPKAGACSGAPWQPETRTVSEGSWPQESAKRTKRICPLAPSAPLRGQPRLFRHEKPNLKT